MYDWVESTDPRLEAISITLVRPNDERAIGELRPREQLPGLQTIAEALDAELRLPDFAWGALLVQPDSLGPWAVLIEPNGWAASMPEVVARLSTFGEAVNAFWNVNAVMSFALARSGTLIRRFDPLLYDDGGESLPEEAGLPWGVGSPRTSALMLLERLTGARVEQEWLLDRRRPTFVVPVPQ